MATPNSLFSSFLLLYLTTSKKIELAAQSQSSAMTIKDLVLEVAPEMASALSVMVADSVEVDGVRIANFDYGNFGY